MKSTLIKALSMILAIMMLAASFVACTTGGGADTTVAPDPDTTPAADPTEAPVDTTEAPAETTKAPETTKEETTPEVTEPPVAAPAEGLLVYREEFNHLNIDDTATVLQNIGWTRLTKADHGVYNETNADFSIVDGRLYFKNYGDNYDGKDGYYQIDLLNDEYMQQVCAGKYTLQYDLEYVECAKADRYAVIITEADDSGQNYNSFHLRAQGRANHQCHWLNNWYTYNTMPTVVDGSQPSICDKLGLGVYDADTSILLNKKITLRLQWDPETGHTVYGKTAEMTEFALLSQPDPDGAGSVYHNSWDGWNVRFKIGAKMNGYVDNIVIWTGWGEMPTAATPDYKPAN